ncbi:MAG: hypothetical protein ABI165_14475 [Bryobacteraceae bacterium]
MTGPNHTLSPAADSILGDSFLSQCAMFYPLGFPMELTTNSISVVEAAAEGWHLFRPTFDAQPARIRLGVRGDGGPLPAPPEFQWRGNLMSIISARGNFMVCDFRSNSAFGWVSRAVAADRGFLRYYFLDAAILSLVQQNHLAPVHGGLVARNGRGVLLCGESLAGKSTLTYACARAGWTFVTDDGTSLVRQRHDRYGIGNPYAIRLRNGARHLFPELAGRFETVRPNGKFGIEVMTAELGIQVAAGCPIDHLVFLNRHSSGPATLQPYPKETALAWCEQFCVLGEPNVHEEMRRSYRQLLTAEVWSMSYRDLDDAVACLARLLECGE